MISNILDFSIEELNEKIIELDEKPFRTRQILNWLHIKQVNSFNEMTNLSHSLRTKLENSFSIEDIKLVKTLESNDGSVKFIFKLFDGFLIESVLIPEEKRTTLCLSTQVGCPLSCAFCKTGQMGYKRNLKISEIVGQVRNNDSLQHSVSNLVFMGMGEPLLNYDNLKSSINILLDDSLYNFSKRKITVSTAGIIPNMLKLGSEIGVNLAISINSAFDSKRSKIMPINKKYPLKLLRKALLEYPLAKRRRITFEYIMIKDFNDELIDAKELAEFLKKIPSKINLIPYNRITDKKEHQNTSHQCTSNESMSNNICLFEKSSDDKIEKFREYLLKKNIHTIIRKSRGIDIGGACGQLGD